MAGTSDATITVIGDLLEDVVVWPSGPVRRGTDNDAIVSRSRGGSAANVSVAVATAGGRARFVGRVGDDDLGVRLCDRLAGCGVEVRVQRAGRTGAVVVLVDADGERTMFPDRAAAGELEAIDPAWLDGTGVLHIPAYALLSSAAPVVAAAREVRRIGGRITVDLSAASVVAAIGASTVRTMLAELRPTVVFANADEATALGVDVTGVDVTGVDVGEMPWPVMVIKRGARPALVVRAAPSSADGVATIVEVPAEAVDGVRDTTGAGDGFAGAFLVAWLAGASIEAACVAGHRGAATVLTSPGAGR